eukprot:2337977-Rhodomonas_salina.1
MGSNNVARNPSGVETSAVERRSGRQGCGPALRMAKGRGGTSRKRMAKQQACTQPLPARHALHIASSCSHSLFDIEAWNL